jgi:BirA family biotin operon repressor/biotin-[acetyl-CoA-carboxylase] ligase
MPPLWQQNRCFEPMNLDPAAVAAGARVLSYETVASTNVAALSAFHAGQRGPLWVTARRQTAGRGRRGRTWVSEPGNLYASLLLCDPSPPECAPELSFVAALALRDALVETNPALRSRLRLKWPNDVLCDGGKVAGILVEGEGGEGNRVVVVVGIGVNCAHHPVDTAYPATDLSAAGAPVSPEALFRVLSRTILSRLAEWDRGISFYATRRAWLAHACGIGEIVRVRLADRTVVGRFEMLDATGRLVLRSADGGIETVGAGEVFPLAPSGGTGGQKSAPPGWQ